MHAEQFECTDNPEPLPDAHYSGPSGPPDDGAAQAKRSRSRFLTFGVAWLFGLETLLSDDENRSTDARRIDGDSA